MHEATRDDTPDTTNWQKFFAIVQAEFRNGTLAEEITCQTVVLITKGTSRDFRGIGLVKVLCKAVTCLLNLQLTAAIKLYGELHGFWVGRGTDTSALKSKLLQHITVMVEAVLFEVSLDPQKAYDALDWDRYINILAEYGVGPMVLQLLRIYWDWLTMVARSSRYLGLPFK